MVFLILFLTNFAQAQINCPGKSILTINRPTGEGNKTFPYTYEYNCKNPSLPTVIHIPGGPGLSSIGSNPLANMNVNVISTDPRGSGANANYWTAGGKEKNLSTEKVADDIIAIIESQKLKNYSLHGSSFGTAVATVAASKLEKAKSNFLPKSIILEGVVGRAEQEGEQSSATRKVFDEIKTEAGFCITCKLDSLQGPLSPTQIGNLMETLQSLGKDTAAGVVKGYTTEQLTEMGKENAKPLGPNELRVYNSIACKEYFLKGITDTTYSKGELTGPSGGSCKDQKRDQPFDSKAWQVKTKTYYVVGTSDNFTPLAQARYHFENQTNSSKEVICVPRGGHTPLKYNMANCSAQVFSKMSAGVDIGPNDLSNCGAVAQRNSFTCGQ
ncbi:MAG: alpha/beta hydrolase [Bdellovibrionales bacterium]|nr:alpha/beta hydrolase [Bdellovibrionales bacterium]